MNWTCPCGASNDNARDRCYSCGRALFESRAPTGTVRPQAQMSEDRREQLRALRLLGAIVMVAVTSGAGLWIFIRQNLGNAPVEHTASPVTVDTRPRGTIVGAAALPLAKEPERLTKLGLSPETAESSSSGESHPLSTLTEAELQRLNQQKRSTEAMLANIDYTLKSIAVFRWRRRKR